MRGLAVSLVVGVCLLSLDAPGTESQVSAQAEEVRGAEFDWDSKGPLDLLAFLKTRTRFTVSEQRASWVKREHVPSLIALLESDEPCGSVALEVSSYIGGTSTIGNEAAYMILGYQRGFYPPDLNSNRTPLDKTKLRQWWTSVREQP